jgi:hypothetical protein
VDLLQIKDVKLTTLYEFVRDYFILQSSQSDEEELFGEIEEFFASNPDIDSSRNDDDFE